MSGELGNLSWRVTVDTQEADASLGALSRRVDGAKGGMQQASTAAAAYAGSVEKVGSASKLAASAVEGLSSRMKGFLLGLAVAPAIGAVTALGEAIVDLVTKGEQARAVYDKTFQAIKDGANDAAKEITKALEEYKKIQAIEEARSKARMAQVGKAMDTGRSEWGQVDAAQAEAAHREAKKAEELQREKGKLIEAAAIGAAKIAAQAKEEENIQRRINGMLAERTGMGASGPDSGSKKTGGGSPTAVDTDASSQKWADYYAALAEMRAASDAAIANSGKIEQDAASARIAAYYAEQDERVAAFQSAEEKKRKITEEAAIELMGRLKAERETLDEKYEHEKSLIIAARDQKIINEVGAYQAMLQLAADYEQQKVDLAAAAAKQKEDQDRQFQQQGLSNISSTLGSISSMMDQNNKKQFEAGKAFAYGMAIIQAAQAVIAAMANTPGPVWTQIAAGVAIAAATAAQIYKISQMRYKGGGGSVSAPSSSGVGAQSGGAQTMQTVSQVNVTLQGDSYGANQIRSLIGMINQESANGSMVRVAAT